MFHEEHLRKLDVIYLGASYSGEFGQISRVNGVGNFTINPTPVALGVLRVKG